MDYLMQWGQLGAGAVLGLAGLGSCLGIGEAAQAAAGCWAKEGKAGKALKFTYVILLSMPISQTLYGMIIMNKIMSFLANPELSASKSFLLLGVGIFGGLVEMFSAWYQGKIGAASCRALHEGDGKGFAFMVLAMGVVETVGIFGFVFFSMMALKM